MADKSSLTLPETLAWSDTDGGFLRLLDQTLLPHRVEYRDCRTLEQVCQAIRELCVRGAPAIGVAAAYGMAVGLRGEAGGGRAEFAAAIGRVKDVLDSSRPTAVNLSWATRRIADFGRRRLAELTVEQTWRAMLDEAHAMAREDAEVCRRIGEHGAALVPEGGGVLTHCNAGALATVAWGTALAALYVAHERGRRFSVFADETRPLLQGARLTAFELASAGIDVTVICDSAAASVMQAGKIQMAIVGADRIAANGDAANKIGTYGVALAARRHGIPFYVAAPVSTFDLSLESGAQIPIELRAEQEVRAGLGRDLVAQGVRCLNPAFDVTPADLITAIVTENGLIRPVTTVEISRVVGSKNS